MKRTHTDKPAPHKRTARRKRTKNPAFKLLGKIPEFIPKGSQLEIDIKAPEFDGMSSLAADLMVRSALIGASDTEKLLIATMIPYFLKIIRPKKQSGKHSKTSPGRTDGPEAQQTSD